MRVIITAATNGEWMPSFQKINPAYAATNKRFSVGFHESGIGLLASSVSLMKMFVQETPSLIIQVGIAGCFDKKVPDYNLEYIFHRIDIDFLNSNPNVELISNEESVMMSILSLICFRIEYFHILKFPISLFSYFWFQI